MQLYDKIINDLMGFFAFRGHITKNRGLNQEGVNPPSLGDFSVILPPAGGIPKLNTFSVPPEKKSPPHWAGDLPPPVKSSIWLDENLQNFIGCSKMITI